MQKVLVVVVLLFLSLSAAAQVNIVRNPDFELDLNQDGLPDGWSINWFWVQSPNQVRFDRGIKRVGPHSLLVDVKTLDVPQNWGGRAYQDVPVEPGATYEISVWVRAENWTPVGEGPGVNISYWLETTGGQWSTDRFNLTEDLKGTFDWKRLSAQLTIPEGMKSVRVALFTFPGTGRVWWDDVRVVRIK